MKKQRREKMFQVMWPCQVTMATKTVIKQQGSVKEAKSEKTCLVGIPFTHSYAWEGCDESQGLTAHFEVCRVRTSLTFYVDVECKRQVKLYQKLLKVKFSLPFADLPTSQITKVYFATPKSVFFTQKVYFTSKSQKDAHYPSFKHSHKNKYNWCTR